jgi:predicted molibdopterin-dependent oxidoreductase YjgC
MARGVGLTARDDSNRITVHPILGSDPRREEIRVAFDERPLAALEGETIAAMLRANGIVVYRTLPDSGSPRGVFCGVGRCPDCMMTVDGELNVRACMTPVRDGMVIETQHGLGIWKATR